MTTLRQLDENPLPDPHQDGFVATPDGFSIRYAVFRTAQSPAKGTILLLHGRNEAIEKYGETIGNLQDAAFDICTFDWRGQGGSTRFYSRIMSGYVDDFEQYAADLETMFSEIVLPDCRPPYYIVAHSTGALISLYHGPAMVNRVRRMVLCSPFLGLPASPFRRRMARTISRALRFLGLGNAYVAGGPPEKMRKPFETNLVTSDPERYARNLAFTDAYPDLGLGGPSAAWTAAVFDAWDTIRNPLHMAATTIPTLIVAAGADAVVSNASCEIHARHLRSASHLVIDGARHELLQEQDLYRDQLLAALLGFIPGTKD
jgi:lysophospholipase